MTTSNSAIKQPDLEKVLGHVLPSLPAAALSATPAENVLPLLSPILRQRVKLLASSSSTDPWIRLLCYDVGKVPRLTEVATSDRLEPHPVSGEVEVDWDYDAEIRYRRVDAETFQALVALKELNLAFRLVYCIGDPEGGDGWKVGEVSVTEQPSPFSSFGGVSSIVEAERQFNESKSKTTQSNSLSSIQAPISLVEEDDDDDDDYWARYDATPARTPAVKRSPAPQSTRGVSTTEEEDYYAQYDDVQPAMDNHDPDEEANLQDIAPPLGLGSRSSNTGVNGSDEEEVEINETRGAWTLANPPRSPSTHSTRSGDDPNLLHPHPRPASSAGSNASVEKLEAAAAKQEQNDFGVKQHVSRSIKSLYMLSHASGIDREEFERIVQTELDTLGLMED